MVFISDLFLWSENKLGVGGLGVLKEGKMSPEEKGKELDKSTKLWEGLWTQP